jgi:nifR3 family TIM-barrel protein
MNATAQTATPPRARTGLITRVRNPYWMAPMSGISDVCHRQLMDELGAGVVVSELVSAKGLVYGSNKTRAMLRVHANPRGLVGIQLFGDSATDLINASAMVAEHGAHFVDVNLGCPVNKVVKKGCGAALMRNPVQLERFLSEIRKNIALPLTVKMRTGWNENEITIHECVRAAAAAGCEWAAIHGRTRAQGYEGQADWDLIRDVKRGAGLPIVGNGDIRSAAVARRRLAESGVDAVMIGRAALRNPWIFKQATGESAEHQTEPAPNALLRRYRELLENHHDPRRSHILLRKFAAWLAYGYPGSAVFRGAMHQLTATAEVLHLAEEFFSRFAGQAPPRFDESEAFLMGGHG